MLMKKYLFLIFIAAFTIKAIAQRPCTPSYYGTGVSAGSMYIFSVTGSGTSRLNDTLPGSSLTTGYANRRPVTAPVFLQQGRSYSGSITYYSGAAYTGNEIWIDFNNDSVF